MKRFGAVFIGGLMINVLASGQTEQLQTGNTVNVPSPTSYAIVSSDANSQVWVRTNYEQGLNGQVFTNTHTYTELATGLNYKDPVTGQWVPSKEQIDILPDGSAAATNGQHQAYFPADIYNGTITLVTPDGLQLQSQPVGLSYDDGANTVLIAELTNSVGELISSNQVIYPNAFIGVNADLLYTYRKSGFEQDIIFRQQPLAPEQYGLNSTNTQLQLLTEFFNPPPPVETVSAVNPQNELADTTLTFGTMTMVPGNAFLTGNTNSQNDLQPTPVYKSWTVLDGRNFLVEQVPYRQMSSVLATLPSSLSTAVSSANAGLGKVSSKRLLPAMRLGTTTTNSTRFARSNLKRTRGVLLDYNTVNGSLTNYTFQGDATYYISGTLYLYGTNTFEGGTVLKYASGASINVTYPAAVLTSSHAYLPAIFTAQDDNSVGNPISGSTGTPAGYYANPVISYTGSTSGDSGMALDNFRFCYAAEGVYATGTSIDISLADGQFINCATEFSTPGQAEAYFENVLFANFSTAFSLQYANVYCQNVTFAGRPAGMGVGPAYLDGGGGVPFAMYFTNCIFANIASLIVGPAYTNLSAIYGSYNGLYNSPSIGINTTTNQFYPFQAVGAGGYYLTNGCDFRSNGTPNIDPSLLADLQTKTTQPPLVYSNVCFATNLTLSPTVPRDNSGSLDLGYHYDPLDYAFGFVSATNGNTVTVNPGTAIGLFSPPTGLPGIYLWNGAQLTCEGLANDVIQLAEFNTVQEGVNTNWLEPTYALVTDQVIGGFSPPAMDAQFTHWSVMAQDAPLVYSVGSETDNYQNCEFYGGFIQSSSEILANFTNCLFQRVKLEVLSSSAPVFQNNLFWNGTFVLEADTNTLVDDNLFDHTIILQHGHTESNAGYNAYVTNCNTLTPVQSTDVILTNSPAYESSWFGNYYLPTNSPLRLQGSTTADQVGLYEFTTQTNQIPEGSNRVDIGYHYVATDASGNPLDTYVSGTPNYIVDSQGNGMDTNGLPYWWEGGYFGETGMNTNSDPDDDGNNLLSDYENGIDPNIIQFSISTTNQYLNNANALIQLTVNAGEPFYYATLVDSTNFSGVTWQVYNSSNIIVNMGSTDGWHNVSVGLRGRPTNATQTWQWQHLDFVSAPLLVITNPASSIVDMPIIQIYGYAQEQLASISYAISNASGILTNQPADITDQYFDTNAFGITTNYFDCLDVQITNGLNVVTLYATDMAGDTTVSNFDFTLDYSSKTNPPSLQIDWPQNGTTVSGTSFTCDGRISDPTATIVASFILAGGDTNVFPNGIYTNTYSGEVGRDGSFSFENLPLNSGTNTFTVTATDVVGNTIATNISVLQTNFVLTINPVSPDSQLWQPTVNLTGTISDPTYAVWVNGVKGTNNGNGTWAANNVPVSNADFTATGYAPSEQQPDGSYGN